MDCTNCQIKLHRVGTDKSGYQRYRCPQCGKYHSTNPRAGKKGPDPIGDRPLTNAEKQLRKYAKKKGQSPPDLN